MEAVNSPGADGWPVVTRDGKELWLTRSRGWAELWRSKKVNGKWQEPELMFSHFVAEATLDNQGNVYFTHHYFKNGDVIEADVYYSRRK